MPEVLPAMNRKIFHIAENSFGVRAVFDGRRNGFTIGPFPFGDRHTLDVTLPEDDTNLGKRLPRSTFKKSKLRKSVQLIWMRSLGFLMDVVLYHQIF
jgi:hypothetical protein